MNSTAILTKITDCSRLEHCWTHLYKYTTEQNIKSLIVFRHLNAKRSHVKYIVEKLKVTVVN